MDRLEAVLREILAELRAIRERLLEVTEHLKS